MKKLVFPSMVALLVSCSPTSKKELKVDFTAATGTSVTGTAVFTEQDGKVKFEAHVRGLTPGEHAIHIHEKADCAGTFESAGGHWNPTFKKHGKWGEGEYHRGDIGNFTVDDSGHGEIKFETDEWCIGCDDSAKDILGKSLIVHEKADDYTTQPTGNAGGRMACSALIAP